MSPTVPQPRGGPGETVVPSLPRRQVAGPLREARQGPAANSAASISPGP